ncbi:AMP-binding protein [Crenobacter intestini]|uniref:Acyl-phosphate glycerol 3-phosphate acyltransferase n=1 Tax=Crenobacter intestini TaxID=2563443 RepID=A0A4T0UTH0_9NEIS|nr:AMP-binding protein [Crenobacter intestini]TIC82067.1 acyl-phosphate glycerol 3-phosphate acyltransferase [Crenobacter intestini]
MGQDERLLAIVRELAGELKPGAPELASYGLHHHLERDFGLDSLSRVELFARVERELGVQLGEDAFAAETPAELLALAGAALAEREQGAAAPEDAPSLGGAFAAAPPSLATLTVVLDWHVRHQGGRVHIHLLDEAGRDDAVSYARLSAAARAVAAGLLAQGAAPGSRVALMLPTGLDFFAVFYGALYAGCVPVPLYPPARPAQLEEHLRRVAAILANSGARWLVTDPRARVFASALSARCPALDGILTVGELNAYGAAPSLPRRQGSDLAFLQYTSGSTGEPKGVMLSHANLLANLRAMQEAARATPDDVFVSWLPLYHDMGLIGAGLGSMVIGFTLVLMSPLAFLARPVRWLQAISRYRGTLSAAPNFAYEICAGKLANEALSGLDLSSWRMACNGAEAVSPQTLERFAARLAPYGLRREALSPVYGLAEASVGLAFPPSGRGPRIDHVARRALADDGVAEPAPAAGAGVQAVPGCGHALPGHALRIVDAAGLALPERRVGRVQFCGPSACAGYFDNPAATAKLFDGAWLNTGDLGYLADGELFITGREKDIIIRGGHNIHPQELEEAVGRIAGVRAGNVVVFAATDEGAGTERLVVLAEVRVRDEAARGAIRRQVEALAVDLTGLPADDVVLAPPGTVLKTSSGKLRRAACRAAYEQGTLLRRARSARRQAATVAGAAALVRVRAALRRALGTLWPCWAWAVFVLCVPLVWCLIALGPTLRLRRYAARTGARLALAAAGLPAHVEGLEWLPANGPVVVVANHASYVDGLLLCAVLPARFGYVAKRELLNGALSALPLRRLGAAFVERFDAARGAQDSAALEARLAAGDALVFFPEGTFGEAPGLLPFHMGAFLAAARTGSPVLPVTLGGTRALLPGERRWPRFARLSVTIHPPLFPSGTDWRSALALRDAARAVMLARVGEPDASAR